jgi:hypothetical protein
MLDSPQFAGEGAGVPAGSYAPAFAAAELERQQMLRCLADFHGRLRLERQTRSLRRLASLWPVALGVVLGAYGPVLRDLAAGYAPWAVTLLFPFSALVGERGLHLSWDATQTLAQLLLYAQFPLEGLLACMVLRHRVGLFKVAGQVICAHVLAVLYLGLVSGSFSQFLAN